MKQLIPVMTLALLFTVAGCSSETEEQAAAAKPVTEAQVAAASIAPTSTRTGKQIYQRHCHAAGAGHPATLLLAEKYGPEKAVIKGRKDLTAVYVKTIVRGGLLEMPPFRPTEITDDELDVIASYILGTSAPTHSH